MTNVQFAGAGQSRPSTYTRIKKAVARALTPDATVKQQAGLYEQLAKADELVKSQSEKKD